MDDILALLDSLDVPVDIDIDIDIDIDYIDLDKWLDKWILEV